MSSSNYQNVSEPAVDPIHLVSAGIAIVAATYGIARYAYGLFLPQIRTELGLGTDVMGMIAGGSYAGYLVATLIGSSISAVTGPRLPVVIGGGCAALGMALIGLSDGVWGLALGVFLAGTSPGFAYPPLSDAVVRMIAQGNRNRAYAWINSGTSFGVILAGPVALWAGGDWRLAWICFAFLAFVATLWNFTLMPTGRHGGAENKLPSLSPSWFLKAEARGLFLAATILGLVTSVYWTFAIELVSGDGGFPAEHRVAFWVFIGVAGIAGCSAGGLVSRYGLRFTHRLMTLSIALSLALLGLFYANVAVVVVSGMLFGACFIISTAVLGIWSIYVFNDRPSAGFGATFFLISLGQLVGPVITGFLAQATGLPVLFLVAALGCALVMLLIPRQDIYSMTP